jgi:hypothetical protein
MASGGKPLTWQQVLAILVFIACFAFVVMAFGQGADLDPVRGIGRYGIAVCAPVFVALLVWHWRATHRPDLEPDVLAQLVPPLSQMQVGRAHLFVSGQQDGRGVHLLVLVQNLCDGDGELRLNLRPKTSRGGGRLIVPELRCQVPGTALLAARILVGVGPMDRPRTVQAYVDASFSSSGRQVRFGRRSAVTQRVSPALTAGLLLTGAVVAGGGTLLTLQLQPLPSQPDAADAAPQPEQYAWDAQVLWSPQRRAPVEQIAAELTATATA